MDHTVVGVRGPRPRGDQAPTDGLRVKQSPGGNGAQEGAELQELADQLQGVFIQQLFKAMRDTVPENGSAFGRAGSEMFSGIMDEHLAEAAAVQLQKGLGQALYRQLSGHAEIQVDPGTAGGVGEELT